MQKLLSLGKHYVSDFLKQNEKIGSRQKYSLDLVLDREIGAAKLTEIAPNDSMWGKYWYRSGINPIMVNALNDVVSEILTLVETKQDDIWLDIACNDGTLLSQVPTKFIKLGIDPADNTYYKESSKIGTIIQDYFSFQAYEKTGYGNKKVKVITTISMFYDLINPDPFIKDVYKILDDNGIWVLQLSYTPLMIKQLAFDNICHEHAYYYSLTSIKKLLSKHGFKIVNCSLNDVNGGSFRIYVQKNNANIDSFGTGPLRDVCNFRVDSLLEYEKNSYDISSIETWKKFANDIDCLKEQVVSFIKNEKAKGKVICGYGASTKGNTLLQYFGLDNTLIDAIAEKSPYKYGYKTVGTEIPILSEEDVRAMKPDYMLVLPWHFISEFIKREQKFLTNGGKFIVPCPTFKVIGA